MKKLVSILALAILLAAPTAQARGHGHGHGHGHGGGNWFGPMLGGMIIGGIVVDAMQPRQSTVIVQQPPVVIPQPNYQIVPPQPVCRYENAFNSNGQYIGQIPVCY